MATASTLPQSPPPPPPSATSRSFVFINDTYGDEAKSKAKRKIVRAQAARGPHSNTLNGTKVDKSGQIGLSKHQQIKRSKKATATTTFPLNVVGIDDVSPTPTTAVGSEKEKTHPVHVRVKDKGLKSEVQKKEESPNSETTVTVTSQRSPTETEQASPSSSSTISIARKMPGTGWGPPFLPYPDPKRPYIPALIDHCTAFPLPSPPTPPANLTQTFRTWPNPSPSSTPASTIACTKSGSPWSSPTRPPSTSSS